MIQRNFRYRLYPTVEQADAMRRTADARRFVYNLALEQRRDFWRQAKAVGVTLNFVTQGRQVTELRRECAWLSAVAYTPMTQTLRDLDRAFAGFFQGRTGFPRFQTKDRHMSFRFQSAQVRVTARNAKWATISIPKIGTVKVRLTRPWRGRILSVTFISDALGWHATLSCEIEHEATPSSLPAVGIDRGIANTISLSTGKHCSTPCTGDLEKLKRRSQRVLSRRQRGSNRYRKQRIRVARISAKIARVRKDWQHRTSTDLARRFGTVVIEDLKTANMTRAGWGKYGLNRTILEQGWRGFETKLAYKLKERGGTLIKVNPAFTSQECSACGTIDKASRESQASFACRHCGFAIHADTNAAINILRRSTAIVEGSGYAPVEARTDHALAA